jgi:tetratricopeptide (TPR) repeat protein
VAPDSSRIEELRRRLQKDPASIAFAQLAEEYRRAGRFQEAVDACRAGLKRHPGYLSARVTLGRALLEQGDLDAAKAELDEVLRAAPQNLAAIRGLAEIHRRRGELREALEQYRAAFELAQNDPGIDQIVRDLRRELAPSAGQPAPAPARPAAATPATQDPAQTPQAPPSRPSRPEPAAEDPARARALRDIAKLEGWLEAILADRRARLYSGNR